MHAHRGFTAVTICCHRGMAAAPITSMRLVTHRGLDLTLLATVYRLVEAVERGTLGLNETAVALDDAVRATHPYPRWVSMSGSAGLAGALALLLGSPGSRWGWPSSSRRSSTQRGGC